MSTEGACVAELRALGRGPHPIIGHDLSFAVQEAAAGATYTDRGRAKLPERILADHGANWVRLRPWVDPPPGYSDLPGVLAMARRAKAAGMRLLLDPHYSDFWADPQKQPIPDSWPKDLPSLALKVHDYTRDVLNALAAQGTPAAMLQLGNEIRNGMLWPTGQLDGSQAQWDALGTLLLAAAAGARDADGPTPRLVVHFDQGGDNAYSRWFYDNIVAQRVVRRDRPVLLPVLARHAVAAAGERRRPRAALRPRRRDRRDPVGWTLENGDSESNFLWTTDLLLPGYPATPNGQLGFTSDLLSIMAAVPNGRGLGVFYWEPEWIPGVGWQPGAGTPNDNLTLFDFSGRALPAASFADPLAR
jgi:arabinogalactan endo-1,4-beta-galactosidase